MRLNHHFIFGFLFFILGILTNSIRADILHVPSEFSSIQSGINSALNGDTVLVENGSYSESIVISGKSITLMSNYFYSADSSDISQTIIDGDNAAIVISIDSSAGTNTSIEGLTIRNGDDGIFPRAPFNISNCIIQNCADGIDYETGSGGTCRNNTFENNSDDGIDLDGAVDIIIENNNIINNDDDGIEIRLHDYTGDTLNITIKNNTISGNGEDGIQLIDYPGLSDRIFYIENNLIINNDMAGIGCMSDGITTENYEGAPIPEPVYLKNNTISANNYGICGGANMSAYNNIVANHTMTAMKNVNGNSLISYSTFWNNGQDFDNCNTDNSLVFSNPFFINDRDYHLQYSSPCIDAGDPDSEMDIDSTIADIGAFAYYQELSAFSLLNPPPDIRVFTQTPDFSWLPAETAGNEPVSYDLYLNTNQEFPDSLTTIMTGIDSVSYSPVDSLDDFSSYYWKILAKNPWSLQQWSNETWNFSINTDTVAPAFTDTLPLVSFDEDNIAFVENSYWYSYIYDEKTADSLLVFQIYPGVIVTVSALGDTHIFQSDSNWFGIDTLHLQVTDLGGLTSSASFVVSVNPVNDAPFFLDLPDSIAFFTDSTTAFNIWDYVSDIESADSLLSFTFIASSDSIVANYDSLSGQVTLSSMVFSGQSQLYITTTDDSMASARDTIIVETVFRDVYPPEIIIPLPVIQFNEDDSLYISDSFWYPYVSDNPAADSLLTFKINPGNSVEVTTIDKNHLCKARANWYGVDTLLLKVTDPGGLTSSAPFVVSVSSINDPPFFINLPDSIAFFGDSSITLNIWDFAADIETADSLLHYDFRASTDSLLINYADSSGAVMLSASSYFDSCIFYITITDDSLASAYDTIQVKSIFRDIFPPQIISPLPLIQFNEDDSLYIDHSFWHPWVSDNPAADSLLIFKISPGNTIQVTSMDKKYLFKAGLNWFGMDTLQLSVTDPAGWKSTAPFVVSVNSVNDPPILNNLPDSIEVVKDSVVTFNIWDLVTDIETSDSLLHYHFKAATDSLLIHYLPDIGIVLLFASAYFEKSTLYITIMDDSSATVIDSLSVFMLNPIGIEGEGNDLIPDSYVLKQNYPNPFNPQTTIIFGLPEQARVKLDIYNMLGQRVSRVLNEIRPAGYHQIIWQADYLSSGIYLYHFSASGTRKFEQIKKMILIK